MSGWKKKCYFLLLFFRVRYIYPEIVDYLNTYNFTRLEIWNQTIQMQYVDSAKTEFFFCWTFRNDASEYFILHSQTGISRWNSSRISTTIRESGASRYHGCPIKGSPETLRASGHYCIEGLKGGAPPWSTVLFWSKYVNTESTIDSEGFKGGTRGAPIMPRDAVSRTANVGTAQTGKMYTCCSRGSA